MIILGRYYNKIDIYNLLKCKFFCFLRILFFWISKSHSLADFSNNQSKIYCCRVSIQFCNKQNVVMYPIKMTGLSLPISFEFSNGTKYNIDKSLLDNTGDNIHFKYTIINNTIIYRYYCFSNGYIVHILFYVEVE